jgi:hypothetical protein
MTEKQKQGVKAIQFLQKMAGIDESEIDALIGWDEMTKAEKENTMSAYISFSKEKLQEENTKNMEEARKQIRIYLDELVAIPDDLVETFNICCQCNY